MPETPAHPNAPEQRTVDVDVQSLDTRGRTLHGYAAVYGAESGDLGGFRERIAPGAFAAVLDADVRCLLNHEPSQVLGRTRSGTLRLRDEARGLRFECDLPDSPLGENVRAAVARGDIDGASFRFNVGEESWEGETRTIRSVAELHDVTVATYGAYPAANVELRTRPETPNPSAATADHTNAPRGQEERTVPETQTQETATPPESASIAVTGPTVPEASTPEPEQRTAGEPESRGGGGLQVEDRSAETTNVEARIGEAIHSIRKGESRSLSTAISVTPAELSTTLFDRLRAASVVLGTGIQTLTTERDSVVYPRLTADVVADAVAEGAAITPSDPTLDTVTATPRKLAALVQTSNEALDDSDPSLATVLNDHLLTVLGLKLDQQLLEGSGAAPQVRGLKNIAGIQSLAAATNGQAPTFDNIADAIALLEAVNVPVERMRLVVHPRNIATLRKSKSSGGGDYIWSAAEPAGESPASVFGVPVVASPQLSTNETQGTSGAVANSAYLYDTQSLVYVQRAPIAVELDRSRLFNSDQSEFRAVSRGDLISPTPTGIVRIAGLLA